MKKWFVIIMIFSLILTFAACSGSYATPPGLRVSCGTEEIQPYIGTYSWMYTNWYGGGNGVDVCGIHPLDREPYFAHLTTTETTATLQFVEEPKSFTVRCWSEEYLGNGSGAVSEEVAPDGYFFELKPGGYIYEVHAVWDGGKKYGGDADYNFYILRE